MLPPVAAPIEAAVDGQAPPRCSHFAQNLWVVLEDLDPLWLTSASGSRRLPRTQFALCTSNPICDIAYSACHSSVSLCAAHPAQPSTLYMLRGGSPTTEQTSGPDDRHGAGELMGHTGNPLSSCRPRDHGLTAALSDRHAWVLNNRKRTRGLTVVPA
jgi:hypothetical protein